MAILLPVVQGWCQRRGISPSRVLMPLSFATLIGGTITLIGTSTSLLASDVVSRLGYGSFELFSFTAIGIPVWLIGACYLVIAGRYLPDRGDQSDDNLQALSRDAAWMRHGLWLYLGDDRAGRPKGVGCAAHSLSPVYTSSACSAAATQ